VQVDNARSTLLIVNSCLRLAKRLAFSDNLLLIKCGWLLMAEQTGLKQSDNFLIELVHAIHLLKMG
jgi:hypothetical protein